MASDISLAVGDGARRMTYTELAAVRGTSQPSAQRLVRRRGWPRQVGNDGVVRVLVPLSEARNVSKSAVRPLAPATPEPAPARSETAPAGPGHIAPASPGQVAPDDRGFVRGLESALEALREQLEVANNSLLSERRRGDELQVLLTQERRQARTSAPDTRSIIKEVIREIVGAAPPDDSDDDKQTLRTLESAIAALREQLESERCRSAQAEARADRAGRRIDELQERLTALLKRRQVGSVPSVQRPETTFDSRLPWWRRWFR
jgi:hypothetical protein